MAFKSTSSLRSLLSAPPHLRTALYRAALTTPTSSAPRSYHSYEIEEPAPYPPDQLAILSAALTHVPTQGFTQTALRSGAQTAGYLPASSNLFPRGEYELVLYHLSTQRLDLKNRIQFPLPWDSNTSPNPAPNPGAQTLSVGQKVRSLVLERLRANVDSGILSRWQEALGLMSLAGNVPSSIRELGLLSDEIWYLSGDLAVDASWYSKRAALMGVYAATEMFQTTDQSSEMRDTEAFLDRRLEEVRVLGGSWRNVREWAGFQGIAAVNMARSFGVRI